MSSDDPRSILISMVQSRSGVLMAVDRCAPDGETVGDYDHRHLALYASLLAADDAGSGWREAAASLLRLDVTDSDAEACWRSHLDRARWIVGDGLAAALVAFTDRGSSGATG